MVARAGKTYAETILEDGPLAYWACQDAFGASTLEDASGNGHDLTLGGTNSLQAAARNSRLGRAVSFETSGDADAANDTWVEQTGDLTLEMWLHFSVAPTSGNDLRLFEIGAPGETSATNSLLYVIYENSGGTLRFRFGHESGSGTNNETSINHTLGLREWNHFVLVRDATASLYTLYVNGAAVGTYNYPNAPSGGTSALLRINAASSSSAASNQRVQYTHVAMYDAALASARVVEHYRAGKRASADAWKNTVFMCNFQGAAAATATPDESSFGRPITFSGNAQLDTAQAPPGCASSLLLDGTGDFVSVPDHPDFELTSNQFTLEAFVRMSAGGRLQTIAGKRDTGGAEEHSFAVNATDNLVFTAFSGGSPLVSLVDPDAMAVDTWYHVVAQRLAGNLWTLHRDGVLVASDTVAGSASTNAQGWTIGRDPFNTSRDWQGWIGPVRFTHGSPRYPASNFTPPAGPFLPYT